MLALAVLLVFQSPASPASAPAPEGVLLEGICVEHPDGTPLPGIHITMRDPTAGCRSPATQTTVTDPEGKFRFAPFPPGRRRLVTQAVTDPVTKQALYPATETDLDPKEPGTLALRLVLGEFGTVRGKVVDLETKAPVQGAAIALRGSGAPAIGVDPRTGDFLLPRIPLRSRQQQIVVEAYGYASTWGVLQMGESSISGMTLAMRRARTVMGTLRDEAGEPVAKAAIDLQGIGVTPFLEADGTPHAREDSPGRIDVRGAEADEAGNWRIDGLDPDFTWSVMVKGLPYRKEGLSAFFFGPREITKRVELVLVEGRPFAGRVLDEQGRSLAGGGVLVCAAGIVNEVFRDRPLLVPEPGNGGGLRWADDAGDRIAFFPDLVRENVRFREVHLAPIDREGKFAFAEVEPGPHLVFVRRQGKDIRTFFRVLGGSDLDWTLTLPAKSEILAEGRALDAKGSPVAGARVKAVGVPEEPGELAWTLAESATGPDGRYSVRFERGGPWRLLVGEGARSGASEPAAGSRTSLDVVVK